jgi:hypothetical protein
MPSKPYNAKLPPLMVRKNVMGEFEAIASNTSTSYRKALRGTLTLPARKLHNIKLARNV